VRFPGKAFLRAHSHLFRFLQHQYLLFLLKRNQATKQSNTEASKPQPHTDPQEGLVIPQNYWANTAKYIDEFSKAFAKFNPKGILLLQASAATNSDIRFHLRALDNGKNIRFVDLFDAASKLAPQDRHLPYDGHGVFACTKSAQRRSSTQSPRQMDKGIWQ